MQPHEPKYFMQKVTLHNKDFVHFLPSDEIQLAIKTMADAINSDYKGKCPLFIVVLNGAFRFSADLAKHLTIDCEFSFIKISSYSGLKSTGEVRVLLGFNEVLKGRDIIVLEDIVDSGQTAHYLLNEIKTFQPATVAMASLFVKPVAIHESLKINYQGIVLPNEFIVGYGLDYDGLGRQLNDLYKEI